MTTNDHANKTLQIKAGIRSKGTSRKLNRLADLVSLIEEMTEKDFTGHIKINFTQGGIGRIEKYEEILRSTGSQGSAAD